MLRKCLILLTLFYASTAHAYVIPDIYTVNQPVGSHGAADKKEAFKTCFEQVLKVATGRDDVMSDPQIQQALGASEQYVQRYSYDAMDDASKGWQLSIVYDAEKVERLLSEAKLPIWGANRPVTMIWVVIERPDKVRQIIGADSPSLPAQLEDEAQAWGLPVVLPIQDLTDIIAVSPTDAWGVFRNVLEEASARYASDAILVLRLKEEADGLSPARWSLLLPDGRTVHWETDNDGQGDQIAAGMSMLAQHLSNQFAVTNKRQEPESLSIRVIGVEDYKDYSELKRYLEGLDITADVSLTAMRKDGVALTVAVYGGQPAMNQTLKLDHHLLKISDKLYKWAP